MIESTLGFACEDDWLHGVLTRPALPATGRAAGRESIGVVVIVGGPQYRVGSHRQFVLLARALAAAGYAVLRFDARGMGDSGGEPRSFERLSDDIAAACDALCRDVSTIERLVLWGLCDGASASLLYTLERRDPRIAGLCLLNPWVRSENTLARAHVHHYYGKRVLQRDFWAKLLRGKVARGALKGFVRSVRMTLGTRVATGSGARSAAPGSSFRDRMAAAWRVFDGSILLLLSGKDLTAREFVEHVQQDEAWRGALAHPRLVRHDLPDADHTFSTAAARRQVEEQVAAWLQQLESTRRA